VAVNEASLATCQQRRRPPDSSALAAVPASATVTKEIRGFPAGSPHTVERSGPWLLSYFDEIRRLLCVLSNIELSPGHLVEFCTKISNKHCNSTQALPLVSNILQQ